MGDARRRRLAAQGTDAFDAIRRFWCCRDPGPAEDFVAPVGTVAITLDIAGAAPSTFLIDAAKVTDAIDQIGRASAGMSYYSIVRLLVDRFLTAKRTGSDADMKWIGLAGAWTSMNHPKFGTAMRTKVAAALRKDGKAHISWHFDHNGLFMALADGFLDLDSFASNAPKDRQLMVERDDADAEPASH